MVDNQNSTVDVVETVEDEDDAFTQSFGTIVSDDDDELDTEDEDELDTEDEEEEEEEEEEVEEKGGDEEEKKDLSTEDFKKFAESLQQYTGLTPEDLKRGIEYIRSVQAKATQELQQSAIQTLQQEWGVDETEVNQRMSIVLKEFKKLPPDQRSAYDTVDGALLLYQRATRQKGTNPGKSTKTPRSSSQYDFTEAQIAKMTEEEYSQNSAKIARAFMFGRVKP